MAKIPVQTYNVFGATAPSTDVEQFGAQEQIGTPNYTNNIATIQALSAWSDGWSAALPSGNRAPYKQDMNAAMLVFSTAISYLYQMGMQEWISTTNYFTNSWVQFGGNIYISLVDNNSGNQPPAAFSSNSFWKFLPLTNLKSPTFTQFLTVGSGTYTPPAGALRVHVKMVAGGGGSSNGGGTGGNSAFDLITCYGGGGGGQQGNNGSVDGGYGGYITSPGGITIIPYSGQIGGSGGSSNAGAGMSFSGAGGASMFAGNWGAGGGPANAPGASGGGGGGGVEIFEGAHTVGYTVGAGGLPGNNGDYGQQGAIFITEYYF